MAGREARVRFDGADEAGLLISGLCVVHCLALPFLLMVAPAFGAVLTQPVIHRILAVLAALSVACALYPASRTRRRWGLAALGSVGTLIVLGSAFGASDVCCSLLLALSEGSLSVDAIPTAGWASLAATPLGCLLIGIAHALNRWSRGGASCQCEACCPAAVVATST